MKSIFFVESWRIIIVLWTFSNGFLGFFRLEVVLERDFVKCLGKEAEFDEFQLNLKQKRL